MCECVRRFTLPPFICTLQHFNQARSPLRGRPSFCGGKEWPLTGSQRCGWNQSSCSCWLELSKAHASVCSLGGVDQRLPTKRGRLQVGRRGGSGSARPVLRRLDHTLDPRSVQGRSQPPRTDLNRICSVGSSDGVGICIQHELIAEGVDQNVPETRLAREFTGCFLDGLVFLEVR